MSVRDLTVGVDPDPDGFHAYSIIETESQEIVDVFQLDWKQWLVGAGDRVEAVVIEWPGMGASFACPSQKLPDGTTRNPINDTIRMAVLLAYELYNRNIMTFIPYRQRLLAEAGRKVSDKGNTDQWVSQVLADVYDVPRLPSGKPNWRGTLLSNTHARSATLCARFPWWRFLGDTPKFPEKPRSKVMLPDLRYKGGFR